MVLLRVSCLTAILLTGLMLQVVAAQPADGPANENCLYRADVPFLDPTLMLRFVNERRQQAGVSALEPRESLQRTAQAKIADIYGGGTLELDLSGQTLARSVADCGLSPELSAGELIVWAGGVSDEAQLHELAFRSIVGIDFDVRMIEHPNARWIGLASAETPDGLRVWYIVLGGTRPLT